MMRLGQAFLFVAGMLGAAAPAHADPQALSSFAPVTIEDAYPTKTGNAELQGFAYWDHGPSGKNLVTLNPGAWLRAIHGRDISASSIC